jgi:hypothetical protein
MTIRIINLMSAIRCLIKGHIWRKTPIVGHVRMDFKSTAVAASIDHGLHHCAQCGRVEFSPWGGSKE